MQKKPNILMIVENEFPADIRVRKEAYHLRERLGISVIALKRKSEKFYEIDGDITIFRVPELPDIKLGKIRYILEYFYFTFISLCIFICTVPIKRYKVVHVHNPPDTLFVIGLLCKLFRIKFIFDHHDLSPNLYLSRFSERKDLIYNTLVLCERFSCQLADAVIATNETYKEIEQARHKIDPHKIFIVRNNPIIEDCLYDNSDNDGPVLVKNSDITVLLFIGAINPQDGVDKLLDVLYYLIHDLDEKQIICNIIGGGDSLQELKKSANDLGLNDYVNFTGPIYDRAKVKEQFFLADIGVEPAPENALNNHSTFIKVMEYMAAGKPIVAFDLKETRYSTNGSALLVAPGDVAGFAKCIQKLIHDRELREELGAAGFQRIVKDLNWEKSSSVLTKVYDYVLNKVDGRN